MKALEEIQFKIRNFFEHNREREAILVIHPDTLDELISSFIVADSAQCSAVVGENIRDVRVLMLYGLRMIIYRSSDAEEIMIAKPFDVINHSMT